MDKVYAPVMITTICRYEKFKRCVESLSRCTDADKTEIFIGVDYPAKESHWEGYRKIRDYLPVISGFKKVNIFIREENWGQGRNGGDLRNRIKEKYDRYISTEDDNEFSPNFLQYMNECLEKYKDNPKVTRICGYSYIEWEGKDVGPFNAIPIHGYCPWGSGSWFAKNEDYMNFLSTKDIIYNPQLVKMLFSKRLYSTIHRMMYRVDKMSGDLRYVCYCNLEDKYCIYPTVSKVRNNGFDNESSNCASINVYSRQIIDTEKFFSLDDFEIKDYKYAKKLHDIHYARSFCQRLLIRFEYWQWKKTGKVLRDYNFSRFFMKMRVKYFLND